LFTYTWNKEAKLLERANLATSQKIDAQISKLNTRIALFAYYLENTDIDSKTQHLSELMNEYEKITNDAINDLDNLKDNEKNEYAIRILIFLEKQKNYIAGQLLSFEHRVEIESLISYIESKQRQVRLLTWMTDNQNDLRYVFTVDEDGEYKLEFANQLGNAIRVFIDDLLISDVKNVSIQKGFHRLQVIDSHVSEGFAPIVFVTKKLSTSVIKPPKLIFQQINPTRYVVHIERATTPFVLALSQQFNRNWKAYISSPAVSSGKQELEIGNVTQLEAKGNFFDSSIFRDLQSQLVSEHLHFQVNGFANGWLIDKTDGDYDIVIQYEPQYLFYIGAFITGIFVLFDVVYLFVRKKS